jgi:uncharacterized protein (DUF2384 family)
MNTQFDPLFSPSAIPHDLIAPGGRFFVRRICTILGVKSTEFALMTDRKVESVSSSVKSAAPVAPRGPKTSEILSQLVQIIGLLRSMGYEEEAASWMRAPLPSFGGRTPIRVIKDGQGNELIARLMALATGNVST